MIFRSDEGVAEWMRAYWDRIGDKVDWLQPYVTFGVEREGELGLGVVFEWFTGEAICMHIVCTNRKTLTRRIIKSAFAFPFETLGCSYVVGIVPAANFASRAFCERLGFEEKRVEKGFYGDDDAVIYVGHHEQLRFWR